jgi:hypothetical protein
VGSADIAGHQRLLDKAISNDIRRLDDLLPDDEADKRETWVKLLQFYGQSQGWQAPAARNRELARLQNHPTDLRRLPANLQQNSFASGEFDDEILPRASGQEAEHSVPGAGGA